MRDICGRLEQASIENENQLQKLIGSINQEENAQVLTETTEHCVIQTLNSEANNVAAQTDIVMEAMANADICDDFPWEAEFKDILMGDAPMLQLQDMTDLQDNAEYYERLLQHWNLMKANINYLQVTKAATHLITALSQPPPSWKQI